MQIGREEWSGLQHQRMSAVESAYLRFRDHGEIDAQAVRPVVASSWRRSQESTAVAVDATVVNMDGSNFHEYRRQHRMNGVREVVRSLLVDHLGDTTVLVALTDACGRLLWVEGNREGRHRAGAINFQEGALWSEACKGTNALGVALETRAAVEIYRSEHFDPDVQAWSCAAAPIFDPESGAVIGAIDVTGGQIVESAFVLPTVMSVAAAAQEELRRTSRSSHVPTRSLLRVLSSDTYYWTDPQGMRHQISRRHAEILLLLKEFPDGVSTDDFQQLLADDGMDPVTVRAEISRLRRIVGVDSIQSRPYRLQMALHSDLENVRKLLAANEIVAAIQAYGRGGLLASSTSPGIRELHENSVEALRAAAVNSDDRNTLWAWVRSPHGRNDQAGWDALSEVLPDFEARFARSQSRLIGQRENQR